MPFDFKEGGYVDPDKPGRADRAARMLAYGITGWSLFLATLWFTSWLWEAIFLILFGAYVVVHYRALTERSGDDDG
jgi:hypothetical protein